MDCSICMSSVSIVTDATTVCGHIYHNSCIQRWLMRSPSCPLCRRELTASDIFYQVEEVLYVFDNKALVHWKDGSTTWETVSEVLFPDEDGEFMVRPFAIGTSRHNIVRANTIGLTFSNPIVLE